MKILCLHGAGGNAKTFQKQTWLMRQAFAGDDSIEFHFTQAIVGFDLEKDEMLQTLPAAALELAGDPPHFTYFRPDPSWSRPLILGFKRDEVDPLRDAETPEQTMDRLGWPRDIQDGMWEGEVTMDYLRAVMDEEGPFDGVLGYSEGAAVGATLILGSHQRAHDGAGCRPLQFGIFLAGAPAFALDLKRVLFADEVGQVIHVPTCHVVGETDHLLPAAMSLYNTCEREKAELIVQTGGHRTPREPEVIRSIADFVRRMQAHGSFNEGAVGLF